MMIGFARNETPEYMPMPISMAHKLTRQLSQVRRKSWGGSGPMSYLRPDGKSQVTVQYEHGRPVRIDTIVVSTQHAECAEARDGRVQPQDLTATLFHCLGYEAETAIADPLGRPVPISRGDVIRQVL